MVIQDKNGNIIHFLTDFDFKTGITKFVLLIVAACYYFYLCPGYYCHQYCCFSMLRNTGRAFTLAFIFSQSAYTDWFNIFFSIQVRYFYAALLRFIFRRCFICPDQCFTYMFAVWLPTIRGFAGAIFFISSQPLYSWLLLCHTFFHPFLTNWKSEGKLLMIPGLLASITTQFWLKSSQMQRYLSVARYFY